MRTARVLCLIFFVLATPLLRAQSAPAPAAVSEAVSVWAALSAPAMDPARFTRVENVEIVRDRVRIKLLKGTLQFTQATNGVVFGAVFHGEGRLLAEPPNSTEAYQLFLFTKQQGKLDMTFTDATFSFTDGLLEEVSKQVVKWEQGPPADDLYAHRQKEREDLGAADLPRLFKSVLSPDRQRTAWFLAELKTHDKGWVEVRYDAMQPEEIRIGRWGDLGPMKIRDIWMNFPAGGRNPRHVYDDPAERMDFLIPAYNIDASPQENADLSATAKITVEPRFSGERVLLFGLDSNLRLSSVKDSQGRNLDFFQARETKNRYQSYGDYVAVALKDAAQASKREILEFQYGGKRVVRRVGNGNYFCPSFGWYPSLFEGEPGVDIFAFYSDFEITFRSPKKYGLVATGSKISDTTDGKQRITNWKSQVPLSAAGFAYGDYKTYVEKAGEVEVQVYANKEGDDRFKAIQNAVDSPLDSLAAGPGGGGYRGTAVAIGELSPAAMVKTIGIETSNTIRLFENYFGPYPYKQIAVTNIAGSYGQGWPGLLYLDAVTFLDPTQRHALGIRDQVQISDFFRAHESSHQWWGQRVAFKSYHDQWLSEGFAEFSGLLYVQFRRSLNESHTQFRKDKELLKAEDLHGRRIDMLGPVWLGTRIASAESGGGAYQDLIYSKGGYILQMLRMQLYDSRNQDPDHLFKDMMQDYCKIFDNKAASTEDFKAVVEKHMTAGMNLDNNHKMDWFFDEYVYGMGMPHYSFSYSLTPTADGKTQVKATLNRSGVPESWKDVVPLYAQIGDRMIRLGTIASLSSSTPVETVLPAKIDKLVINYFEDLLADVKQ
jgi:hypothetical protein